MALFGEVVYPSSRAFWTEDDDDDNQITESPSKTFSIEWLDDFSMDIKTFIVAETELIIEFIKDLLLANAVEVCKIVKTRSPGNPSKIYKASGNLWICLVSPDVDWSQAGEFINTISELLLKSSNTVALTSNHRSQLKSHDESISSSFLKSLSTRKARSANTYSIPMLEQPNIVSGVAAGVVACAEVMNACASLNILYPDCYELDSESAAPLINLLSKVLEHEMPEFTCKKMNFNKDSLYMAPVMICSFLGSCRASSCVRVSLNWSSVSTAGHHTHHQASTG